MCCAAAQQRRQINSNQCAHLMSRLKQIDTHPYFRARMHSRWLRRRWQNRHHTHATRRAGRKRRDALHFHYCCHGPSGYLGDGGCCCCAPVIDSHASTRWSHLWHLRASSVCRPVKPNREERRVNCVLWSAQVSQVSSGAMLGDNNQSQTYCLDQGSAVRWWRHQHLSFPL